MPAYEKRAFRVQGERPDGTTATRDFLDQAKAERAAEKMRRSRTEVTEAGIKDYPAMTNVRIVRSAPLRWLYPNQTRTHSPLPELVKRQEEALAEVLGLHQRNSLTGNCFVCIDIHDQPQAWPCETVAVVQEALGPFMSALTERITA